MEKKRLQVIETSNELSNQVRIPSRRARRDEAQAQYERAWLQNSTQFDPGRNCMERERLERTWHLITAYIDVSGKRIVDLGCGNGLLARRLRDAGAVVQAVDIASNALNELKKHDWHDIDPIQDALPETTLPDSAYDIVVSTDVIAEIPRNDHRLYVAELARLVNPKGYVVCSTPIDIRTEDALNHLAELMHTEFNTVKWVYSYHALYIRLKEFFQIPGLFAKAYEDKNVRQQELQKRKGFNRWWFKMNSTLVPALFWVPLSYLTNPLVKLMRQNRTLLIQLEKICRFFSDINGVSHAIFIGQRRPLEIPDIDHRPVERPKKRTVWE